MGILESNNKPSKKNQLANAIRNFRQIGGTRGQSSMKEIAEAYGEFRQMVSSPTWWKDTDDSPLARSVALKEMNDTEQLLDLPLTAVLTDPRELLMPQVMLDVQRHMAQGEGADSLVREINEEFGENYPDYWFLENVKNPALMMSVQSALTADEEKPQTASSEKKTVSKASTQIISNSGLTSMMGARNFKDFMKGMQTVYGSEEPAEGVSEVKDGDTSPDSKNTSGNLLNTGNSEKGPYILTRPSNQSSPNKSTGKAQPESSATKTKSGKRDNAYFQEEVEKIVKSCGPVVKKAVEASCNYWKRIGKNVPWNEIYRKLTEKHYTSQTGSELFFNPKVGDDGVGSLPDAKEAQKAYKEMAILSDPVVVAKAIGAKQEGVKEALPLIINALKNQGILDKNTLIAAIATVLVECDTDFKPVKEKGSTEYFDGKKYGKEDKETKQRYFGRGYIQITTKNNYKYYGNLFDVDLENNPDKALEPELSARILAGFFSINKIHTFANKKNWKEVRRLVNHAKLKYKEFKEAVDKLIKACENLPGETVN